MAAQFAEAHANGAHTTKPTAKRITTAANQVPRIATKYNTRGDL